ncbi:MAG: adenylyl-sulfate kinase, partial [Alphaproteobacteria bacterium]
VGFDQQRFKKIAAEFEQLSEELGFKTRRAIPLSARFGDNVIVPSPNMPWYDGPQLLRFLEDIDVADDVSDGAVRLPIQMVSRPDAGFRGYAGTIASGRVTPGDTVVIASTGQSAAVRRIVTMDGDLDEAIAGMAVTVTLDKEIDVSRGDILVDPGTRPEVSDQLAAHIIWMSNAELLPGRSYLLKSGTRTVGAAVSELKHRVDVDSFKPFAAKTLRLNDIGFGNLSLVEPIAFDPYTENRSTGSFILIDRFSNATVAAGMIRFGLRRATNIHRQALTIDKTARAGAKDQKPCVLWFTGLSGAGKSVIANLVEEKLHLLGNHTYLLDGDNVRHGLNRDLGFTDADRVENIRRVGEAAKLFVDAGLIVLVSFISPFRSERRMARDLVSEGEFVEVFVDVPLEVAERRDPKGLYRKARAGTISHFTGIDSPYEKPEAPDIHLDAAAESPEALAEKVTAYLLSNGYVRRHGS